MKRSDIIDDFDFNDLPDESGWDEADGQGKVVGKYFSLLEAEVAAARLRSEGIPCFIANEFSQTMLPGNPSFVRLHVREADAETAQQILAEHAPPEQEDKTGSVTTGCFIIAAIASVIWLVIQLLSSL